MKYAVNPGAATTLPALTVLAVPWPKKNKKIVSSAVKVKERKKEKNKKK